MQQAFATLLLALVAYPQYGHSLAFVNEAEKVELCEFKEVCYKVSVDTAVVDAEEVEILGAQMELVMRKEADDGNVVVAEFRTGMDSVVISVYKADDGSYTDLFANGVTQKEGNFEIDYVSALDEYVLSMRNTRGSEGDDTIKKEGDDTVKREEDNGKKEAEARSLVIPASDRVSIWDLLDQGKEDSTTEVEVTVTMFYTTDVRAKYGTRAATEAKLYEMFETAAMGFKQSDTLVKLTLNCVKPIPVSDNGRSTGDMLQLISGESFNGGYPKQLNGADISLLVVANVWQWQCGEAYVGVRRWSYAIFNCNCDGQYSLTHELGHIFGADHNRENTEKDDGEGFGYWLPGFGKSWRTCMAYSAPDGTHQWRMNYFSDSKKLWYDGSIPVPNGVERLIDNKEKIRSYRFYLAAHNNEATGCSWRGL